MNKIISFPREVKLFRELQKEANEYFKKNKLKKTGDIRLYLKAFLMFCIFLVPLVSLYFLSTFSLSYIYIFLSCLVLGIVCGVGMSGVGMNVMHDANHGVFSSLSWVNKFFGASIYILSGNVYNWIHQHNEIHHMTTNIHHHDDDLDAGVLFRFTKEQVQKPWHKWQYIYAPFLYGFMTLAWATIKDWRQLPEYLDKFKEKKSVRIKQWLILIFSKIVYFSIWLIFPILFSGLAWYFVVFFFLVMHYVCGFVLTLIFQLAHVVPKAQTYDVSDNHESWFRHQLLTSCNFATANKFLRWFCGGLTHQKEHHVFPKISHVHYPELEKIFRKFCKKYDIPYIEYRSFTQAVVAHFQLLYSLGNLKTV